MVSSEYKEALLFTAKVFAGMLASAIATAVSYFLGFTVASTMFSYVLAILFVPFGYGMLRAAFLILSGRATRRAKERD